MNDLKGMRIISVVNFVRGGKSSIARLLAEKLGTTILNFDPKRDGKFYNAITTTNIPEGSTIHRGTDELEIETNEEIIKLKSKSKMFICDFGGRFDERINDFPSDVYIIPMMNDFESISESVRATIYITSENPKAKIIHVLNMVMSCDSKKDKETFIDDYKYIMKRNKVDGVKHLIMPKSKLLKRLVDEKLKRNDVIGNNAFLEKGAYKNIVKFVDELVDELGIENK